MRHIYIVCYDISDGKRLRIIYKMMRGFGRPIQYSVFHCNLSNKEKVMMLAGLQDEMHLEEDRIMVIDLGPDDGTWFSRLEVMGLPMKIPERKPTII